MLFFLVTYDGITNPISIDQNSNGNSAFQLPSGPESDSYKISLYVNVMDDSDGVTQYNIPTNAVVKPNNDLVNSLASSFIDSNSDSANNNLIQTLTKGSVQSTATFVNSFALMLDSQTNTNLSDKVIILN
jgi:hypothetical protein